MVIHLRNQRKMLGRSEHEELDSSTSKTSKRARESQLEDILFTLREKHGDEVYSGPQLRIWAQMHLNAQHPSLDIPPNIPLFGSKPSSIRPKKDSLSDALTFAATAVVGLLKGGSPSSTKPSSDTMSPGKRAQISGQYLEHLEKLQALKASGVLNDKEFEEQKTYALNNIRHLNKL